MNQVWVLFASGERSRVSVTLHPGRPDRSRPADAYVVTGGGMSDSARRAAEAVHNWLRQQQRNPDRFVAGFDLEGSSKFQAGDSGGLAFAIALAAAILGRRDISASATGAIDEAAYPGPLTRVDGINEKLAATLALEPGHTILCYPKDNDLELESSLRDKLQDKGIRLYAVVSVAEALDLVFADTRPAGQSVGTGRRNRSVALAAVGLLLAAVVGWGIWSWDKDRVSGDISASVAPEELAVEVPAPALPEVPAHQQPEPESERRPATDQQPQAQDQGFD